MSGFLSKSRSSADIEEGEVFEKGIEDPDSIFRENIKNLKPDAIKIKNVCQMPGWTDIIKPFLEKSTRVSGAYQKKGEEREMMLILAVWSERFLNLVNNLLRIYDEALKLEAENKDKKKG